MLRIRKNVVCFRVCLDVWYVFVYVSVCGAACSCGSALGLENVWYVCACVCACVSAYVMCSCGYHLTPDVLFDIIMVDKSAWVRVRVRVGYMCSCGSRCVVRMHVATPLTRKAVLFNVQKRHLVQIAKSLQSPTELVIFHGPELGLGLGLWLWLGLGLRLGLGLLLMDLSLCVCACARVCEREKECVHASLYPEGEDKGEMCVC